MVALQVVAYVGGVLRLSKEYGVPRRGTPLVNALKTYVHDEQYSFHMPGHKKGRGAPQGAVDLMGGRVFEVDATEVPGLDDLHEPSSVILEAQHLAADTFGADETYFLVNGSSAGIQALMLGSLNPGDKILLPRNAHRSVVAGLILSGAMPVWVPSRLVPQWGIDLGVPDDVFLELISKLDNLKALLIVYPNYYGLANCRLAEIIERAHYKNMVVLVDEAHGAHFTFDKRLPVAALRCGADGVVQSTHKLLGSLTQTAMLHIQGDRLDKDRVWSSLTLLQTTSPSYLLLASLDAAQGQMSEIGEELVTKTVDLAYAVREELGYLPGTKFLREEEAGQMGFRLDPTKLVIGLKGYGGRELAEFLRLSKGLQIEMAFETGVLAMLTIGDSQESARYLVEALRSATAVSRLGFSVMSAADMTSADMISQDFPTLNETNETESPSLAGVYPSVPPLVMSPREAFLAPKRLVPLSKAIGLVSGEIVAAPYPPGYLVLVPGEMITSETVGYLELVRERGIGVHGWVARESGMIQVVR